MARTQTMVQLSDELVAALDDEAELRNMSRSALIRQAVTEFLHGQRQSRAVDAYVEGYRRVPPQTPDGWGDLEAANDRAGHETAERMDLEADQAGVEW
ncbi:MAG: ribbon-helix-helix domain-containing protein [Acidimicrobiia bacterium]|nr:ribbon-helix-helix domain-containing protein [Acidimicrobiia bacterium]